MLELKTEIDINKLWHEFQTKNSPEAREQLIIYYAPLVKYIVNRLMINLPSTLDTEDLIGYGIIGLIQSIEKFSLAKGIKFETFASQRIRGAIIDELRNQDFLSRTLRQKAKNVEKAIGTLEQKLGRPPTEEEIAQELNITLDELFQTLSQTSFLVMSLDYLLSPEEGDKSWAVEDTVADDEERNPYNICESKDLKEGLIKAIDNLPEREKLLITLYYYEGLTMKEIGQVMNITEARVCQLHTQAILRMKAFLKSYA